MLSPGPNHSSAEPVPSQLDVVPAWELGWNKLQHKPVEFRRRRVPTAPRRHDDTSRRCCKDWFEERNYHRSHLKGERLRLTRPSLHSCLCLTKPTAYCCFFDVFLMLFWCFFDAFLMLIVQTLSMPSFMPHRIPPPPRDPLLQAQTSLESTCCQN